MALADFDAPRLQGFRHPSDKVDPKQAVLKGCSLDLDMIGD
jgi:hypothetical protein